MAIRISFRGRVFKPSWPMTLLTILLLAAFLRLGFWQWDKGVARQQEWEQFAQAPAPTFSSHPASFDDSPRFGRVSFPARLEPEHQFLLDNRFYNGQPGYEVLTPAVLNDGRRILVNRGWVAFTGYRDRLPDVTLHPGGDVTITGRLDELPSPGLASGRAPPDGTAQWPKVTAFPSHAELQHALGQPIARRIVLLDPQVAGLGDYPRQWTAPGLAPVRHFSYAIQWWGFALVALVLYFGLNFRKVD